MWRYSALKGGGGTPTPTPTPTQEIRTFGSFGLSATSVSVAAGNGTAGAQVSLTTSTTAALDGLILSFTFGQNRTYWANIIVNGVTVVSNYPINLASTNGGGVRRIPIPIPSGADVKIALASNASISVNVLPFGYQSNVASGVSSIFAPSGSALTPTTNQGASVTLTGTTWTAWTQIGTSALAVAAKGLATVHLYASTLLSSRPGTGDIYYEVGYGPNASNVTSITPTYGATDTSNNVMSQDAEPIFATIPSGNFLFFRAKANSANTDPVNCQVAVMQ